MLHGYIEYITVEEPGSLAVKFENNFIVDAKRAQTESGKFSQHLVMVSREVNDLGVFCKKARDVFHNLHVRFRPVSLAELPHVDDVTVENKFFGLYRLEVSEKLFGMTAIGSEMNIG
jgi:hypothetical protein